MKKTILAIFIVLLGFILYPVFADNKTITLGENEFCIPKKYSALEQASGPLFNISALTQIMKKMDHFKFQ